MVEQFDLKKRFFDLHDYAVWLKSNCALCALQKDGVTYGCALLKALDKAVVSGANTIPITEAKRIWNKPEAKHEGSTKCQEFISRRAKPKPKDDVAP